MSRELQDLIEKDELVQDAMRLQEYRCHTKTDKKIDEIRNELADEVGNDMEKLDIIYQFAEKLKKALE